MLMVRAIPPYDCCFACAVAHGPRTATSEVRTTQVCLSPPQQPIPADRRSPQRDIHSHACRPVLLTPVPLHRLLFPALPHRHHVARPRLARAHGL